MEWAFIRFIADSAEVKVVIEDKVAKTVSISPINPINLYSLFSILSAIILLVRFFYSGHELLTNPQNYAKSDNDYGLY